MAELAGPSGRLGSADISWEGETGRACRPLADCGSGRSGSWLIAPGALPASSEKWGLNLALNFLSTYPALNTASCPSPHPHPPPRTWELSGTQTSLCRRLSQPIVGCWAAQMGGAFLGCIQGDQWHRDSSQGEESTHFQK